MKKLTPILISVGLCLFILGGTVGVITWLNGATGYQGEGFAIGIGDYGFGLGFSTNDKPSINDDDAKTEVRTVGGKNYESKRYELDRLGSFDKVDIDIGVAEATLSQDSDKGFVQSENFPEGKFKCSVSDGVLYIREEGSHNMGVMNINQPKRKLTIALPEDVALANVTMDLGVGSVKLSELSADDITINGGVGDLDAGSITAETVEIEGGVGSVKITDLDCREKLTVMSGVGETDIKGVVIGEAQLEAGVGSLYFDGEILGDFSVNSGTGEIDITLAGSPDYYYFTLDRGMGSMVINGEKIKKDVESYGSSSAPYSADISNGVGSTKVSFR